MHEPSLPVAGKKVIYIAGPYRAKIADGLRDDAMQVQRNVMSAMEKALDVWAAGHAALCPHANTMFFQNAKGIDDDIWLVGDLELVRRCDAVYVTDDWKRSTGARGEVEYARALNIPVLLTKGALLEWLAKS